MSAYVDAIAAHLVGAGLVPAPWEVDKLGAQPTPDQTITIYETGGPEPEQASDRAWRRPTFQLVTRAAPGGNKTASDKAHQILTTLNRASVNGFKVFSAQQSVPVTIGPDEKGRPLFAVNFRGMEA